MKEKSAFPHKSVLLNEVVQAFEGCKLLTFVDGTLGAGGHAEALLSVHPEIKQYVGIDQDPMALEIANKRLSQWQEKVKFFHANYSDILTCLNSVNNDKCDGILLDLGVSSMQLDIPERGFSFSKEGPLDMRMNTRAPLTAAEIVNTWSEKDLGRVFREYGEEKQWRKAARAIVEARSKEKIETTTQLVEVLRPLFFYKRGKEINPLTLIFQALRIAVNGELDVLESFLDKAFQMLNPGGRLAVISFHSLEDRIVKTRMREAASDKWSTSGIGGIFLDKTPLVRLVHRKAIAPGDREVEENPRSRSAKMRVVEKI